MSNQQNRVSVSYVRTQFSLFFQRVMVLYNLRLSKEEKDHKVENVKGFTIELYDTGYISDYIKETIDNTIEMFALLLPGQIKKRNVDLDYLDACISLNISDINSEIGGLIH